MTIEREHIDLLRQAFPRDPVTDRPICAWDGRTRGATNALCYGCWKSLTPSERAMYMALDIFGRAEWIIENKPDPSARPGWNSR